MSLIIFKYFQTSFKPRCSDVNCKRSLRVRLLSMILGSQFYFPIHRWIQAKTRYTFTLNDCCLPQHETEHAQRSQELERKKAAYKFKQHFINGPAQVTTFTWICCKSIYVKRLTPCMRNRDFETFVIEILNI